MGDNKYTQLVELGYFNKKPGIFFKIDLIS